MLEVELIANYLIENSYVSSERAAYEFIPHMSDKWLTMVLEELLSEESFTLYDVISEMRKEDKVKGKTKTPSHVKIEGMSKLVKTPEGKWAKNTPIHQAPNPDMLPGRYKQGMPMDPKKAVANYQDYVMDRHLRRRHAHGGGELGVPEGRLRGKKKERGAPIPQPQSPVSKFIQNKKDKESRANFRNIQSTLRKKP